MAPDTLEFSFAAASRGPRHSEPCRVAVIGAGFSGTMSAIHLNRLMPPGYGVLLCERSGRFARGLAYSKGESPHLLNVRCQNMSAFPDAPGHFSGWLAEATRAEPGEAQVTEAGIFATRRLYGRYLRAVLLDEIHRTAGRLRLWPTGITSITPVAQGYRLDDADGRHVTVRHVVLATGNLQPSVVADGVVFRDPWCAAATAGLAPDRAVLVVGTGLTMVDLVLAIRAQGFAGPIVAVSRRGLLPQRHRDAGPPWPAPDFTPTERASLPALLHRVRAEVATAAAAGRDWRCVVDGLRPVTAALWRGLPAAERDRFLRHLRPFWDAHRHRMAPPVADAFAALHAGGIVRLLRGRVVAVERDRTRAVVTVRRRGGGTEHMPVQRVIHATGVGPVAGCGDALVGALLDRGLARLDPHGLGLEVTDQLQVVGASGVPTPGLWALGPLVRGMLWECTAVPDIRGQAQQLAARVAADIEDHVTAYRAGWR